MENNDNKIKNLFLAKVWNQILRDDILPNKCQKFTDLNNYAFRLNLIIRSDEKNRSEEFDYIVAKCNDIVARHSKLDDYLNIQDVKTYREEIDITTNSFSETKHQETNSNEVSVEKKLENPSNSSDACLVEITSKNSLCANQIISNINAIKQALDKENGNDIQKIINDLVVSFDSKSLEIFSINFLNIDNFKPEILNTSMETLNLSIGENQICLFFENLISLNSSHNLLPYNICCLFLKFIFLNFIMTSIKTDSSHENIARVLSRKIMSLGARLCNEFQSQFVVSCLVPFIIEASANISNKIVLEFILKLIRENLDESGCNELMSIILNEFNGIKWTEIIYSVLAALIENISNLKTESVEIILNKMKNDSADLCKSTVFSKFLLNLLNKLKNKTKSVTICNHQNKTFSSMSQLSQSNECKISKPNDAASFDKNFIDMIEIIVNNNKTLIKKTLQNLIKNFKN